MFSEKDLGPILRRFKVVTMADLPPAPPKQKRTVDNNINLEEIDENEFDPKVLHLFLFVCMLVCLLVSFSLCFLLVS